MNPKTGKQINCRFCNKLFYVNRRRLDISINRCCSIDCHAKYRQNIYLQNHKNDDKFTQFFYRKLAALKSRSKRDNLPFDLDVEYLRTLYNKQNGLCHYTKLPMILKSEKNRYDYNVLSIDKIVPENGYTRDNIVMCLFCINMMKSDNKLEDINKVFKAIKENTECN